MGEKQKKRPSAGDVWRMILFVLGVIAVVQELRKPSDQRTWHGTVAGFVPYDFRKPSVDRIRDTYWNPDAPVVQGKAMGVGWALNLGAVKKMIDSR